MTEGSDEPRVEPPTPEVERPVGPARMPGAPRAGYAALPTGPVDLEPTVSSGPTIEPVDAEPEVHWAPDELPHRDDDTRLAPWALVAAIVALISSWFVGWGIPLAIVAVVASIMSLRRPVESRAIARWALVLGLLATIYSLGWLIWAAMQFELQV